MYGIVFPTLLGPKPRAQRCRPRVALQSLGSPGEAMAAWGNPINICAQQISRIDVPESAPQHFFRSYLKYY